MIAELLVLASLLRLDPSGDAHGAGDLIPPTAQVYSSLGPFDLVAVEVVDEPQLVVRVRLGEIPDPGGLPNGVTLPIVDVYLDTGEGGSEDLLPGPGMRMPSGRGWDIAVRVHGDDAYAVLAADPDGVPRPVRVTRSEDTLRIEVPMATPVELVDIHAVTGAYDPFSVDGWRPLADRASPWAFASDSGAPPVVDLLAEDDETQRAALRTFTLPSSPRRDSAIGWLIAMVAGLVLAIVGLWLRRRVPPPAQTPATVDGDAGEPSAKPDAPAAVASGTVASGDTRTAASGVTSADTSADTSGDTNGSVLAARRAMSPSDRDGADLVLPTIWASSDGWWSESDPASHASAAGDTVDEAAVGETVGDDVADELDPRDEGEDERATALDADAPDIRIDADALFETDAQLDADEDEAPGEDDDGDGVPRSSAGRPGGAS